MFAPATLSASDAVAAAAHTAAANAADAAAAAATFAACVAVDAAAAAVADVDPLPFDIFGTPIPARTWGASSAAAPESAAAPAPKKARLHIGPPTRGGVRECERVAALISAGKKLAGAFRKRVIAANCLNVGYVIVVDISPNQASMAGATTWAKFVAYIDYAHRTVDIDPQISKRFAHIDASRFALVVIRVGVASEVVVVPLPWTGDAPVDHCSHCGSTTRACVGDGVRCVL